MRVDEDERTPAAQHELVDRVERRVGQALRVDDHQHADPVRDLGGVARDGAHVEELAELGV